VHQKGNVGFQACLFCCYHEGGISRMTPHALANMLHSLPPILHSYAIATKTFTRVTRYASPSLIFNMLRAKI